jgi:leader peptidase (prepilin peptidase)/N-methyltransferase
MPILLASVAVLGVVIGSFLNVVIYRIPRGESLIRPGSHCPSCAAPVRARHNLPVAGWLLLRGRCADCRSAISVRYPLVEVVTGALFVAVTSQVAHLDQLAALPAYLFFTAAGVALTAIDLDEHRLPNAIVYPTYLALAALFTIAALLDGSYQPLVRAAIGGAALFAGYLALVLVYPAGMGLGDVKLAGVIGATLGFLSYPALVIGAFAAFVVGGFVAVVLVVLRHATGKTAIPFGPAMVAGALLAIFFSAPLADAYSQLAQTA